MLREETDFIGNAVGIDPAGCGCTDCLIGNSMPEDSYEIKELVKAHLEDGRDVVNRANGTIIMYKDASNEYQLDIVGSSDVAVIRENPSWDNPDEYTAVLHTSYCTCNSCERGESVPLDREEAVSELLTAYYEGDDLAVYNSTGYTLLTLRLWNDAYTVMELSLSNADSEVSILTYN